MARCLMPTRLYLCVVRPAQTPGKLSDGKYPRFSADLLKDLSLKYRDELSPRDRHFLLPPSLPLSFRLPIN